MPPFVFSYTAEQIFPGNASNVVVVDANGNAVTVAAPTVISGNLITVTLAADGQYQLQVSDSVSDTQFVLSFDASSGQYWGETYGKNLFGAAGSATVASTTGTSVTAGVAAGAGATVSITPGSTDARGTVTVSTGAGAGAGVLATVALKTPLAGAPGVQLTPAAAGVSQLGLYVTGVTGAGFSVACDNVAASNAVAGDYQIAYDVTA